jgi:hypothetical protein
MSASYWKKVGESAAKGLGQKTIRRFGIGGKMLGRTTVVVGIGFLAYELFKNYKENVENEPAYKEMAILRSEMEKWTGAISCLGRQPFENKKYGSVHEGGAINALYRKKVPGKPGAGAADPKEAYILIARSINYIRGVENIAGDSAFEEKRKSLIARLKSIQGRIKEVGDYTGLQKELAEIVNDIKPVESGYASRIYDCRREIQKTLGSNAAWAAISMTTLGFVKKPEKKIKSYDDDREVSFSF